MGKCVIVMDRALISVEKKEKGGWHQRIVKYCLSLTDRVKLNLIHCRLQIVGKSVQEFERVEVIGAGDPWNGF